LLASAMAEMATRGSSPEVWSKIVLSAMSLSAAVHSAFSATLDLISATRLWMLSFALKREALPRCGLNPAAA
jgi:hypothetical protein